jgi:SPP1 gp7 family putative phage head morphogenesis protein
MTLTLYKAFAPSSAVDGRDARALKILLNRLGYYVPPQNIGITDVPDREIFSALKKFQKASDLRASGEMRPGDATVAALNAAEAEKLPKGAYIWRTAGDEKVRDSHAAAAGKTFSWDESPVPGEEPGCRCWAELTSANCELEEINYINALAAYSIANQNLEQAMSDLTVLERELQDIEERIKSEKEERERAKDSGGAAGGVIGGKIGTVIGSRLPPPLRPGGGILGDIIGEEIGEVIGVGIEEGADIFTKSTTSDLENEKSRLEEEIQKNKENIEKYNQDVVQTGETFEAALDALAACEARMRSQ